MGEYARRAGGGRPAQPDGSHGRCVRLPRSRAAPPALCATFPPLRGREESARPCQRPDRAARVAHAPCLAGPGVRRAGRWRGARAGGPGTVGCVGVSAPDAVTLRGAGWTGGLASGDCPPSAGCRTRRLVRVTPARRAPPTRTRRARAHPTRPRTLRFSSPRRHIPARPTHAAASGADPGRPPHAAGSRRTMRPAGGGGDNSDSDARRSEAAQAFGCCAEGVLARLSHPERLAGAAHERRRRQADAAEGCCGWTSGIDDVGWGDACCSRLARVRGCCTWAEHPLPAWGWLPGLAISAR